MLWNEAYGTGVNATDINSEIEYMTTLNYKKLYCILYPKPLKYYKNCIQSLHIIKWTIKILQKF